MNIHLNPPAVWLIILGAIVGGLAVGFAVLAELIPPLKPATPALLQDATASGGGWWRGDCPANLTDVTVRQAGEIRSPTIDARLLAKFPPGTSASALSHELLAEGFTMVGPCADDASIEQAEFRQQGGGLFGPYPAYAQVHWKVDKSGHVVWARGWIAYTGP